MRGRYFVHLSLQAVAAILFTMCASAAYPADSPKVTLNVSKTGPRAVEPLTQKAILRDYRFAWTNLAQALETNSTGPLNGLFAGTADDWLRSSIESQQRSGITRRYSNQTHALDAAFYAPEGDVIELHDTAEYDIEISDGSKLIHTEHALVRYVVLMTPGADRWVVRQLQAVSQF